MLRNYYYLGPKSDHFDGQSFHNTVDANRSFWQVLQWQLNRNSIPWPAWRDIVTSKPPATISGEKPLITFVNHATVLIQVQGINILTDPVWAERCSPFKHIGPKRVHAPGIRLEDLPQIDLILLSHNHYDHMDLETLNHIRTRDNPLVITGLGNKMTLGSTFEKVVELDWWNEHTFKDFNITYVPAQHFSSRFILDKNWALWGGFFLQSKNSRFYFAGDTGLCSVFKEIKDRLGVPDVSFLPIGAYEPRWFMQPVHMSPVDALDAHEILESRLSIPIHYGTFKLSDEGIDDPVNLLESEMHKRSIPHAAFRVMKPGESLQVSSLR